MNDRPTITHASNQGEALAFHNTEIYKATTTATAAPITPTIEPTNATAPPVKGIIGEVEGVVAGMVMTPVPVAEEIMVYDAEAVGNGDTIEVAELIDELDELVNAVDTVDADELPASLDNRAAVVAAELVVTGAMVIGAAVGAAEVETVAAEVAVATHSQTEDTAVSTAMPVTAPQALKTQPAAEA
ncbi:hypothetical protein MMC19_001887 [Ptychographa xylographoides]|nr:hypothetical protein [Ptychographa xylographoides]